MDSLVLLFVFTEGKRKKKWVHKLKMGLLVLLPVTVYSNEAVLTVLEINQDGREDSEGLQGK